MSPGKFISLLILGFFISITLQGQSKSEHPIFDNIVNDLRHYDPKAVALFESPLTYNYRKHLVSNTQIAIRTQSIEYLLQKQPYLISIDIPNNNQTIAVHLQKVDLLTNDFQVLDQNGQLLNWGKSSFYRGVIDGDINSLVTMSVFENQVSLWVNTLEVSFEIRKIDGTYHIISDEIDTRTINCHTPEEDLYTANIIGNGRAQADCLELMLQVDYEMYLLNGSNSTNATTWATDIFNSVASVYANDGVPLYLRQLNINTAADFYTPNLTTSLNQFVTNNSGGITGQIGLLMSGVQMGGGISQGIGGYCSDVMSYPGPFAIAADMTVPATSYPTYSYNVMIMAHELGHVMGLRHTHACVWNGNNTQIDDCGNVLADQAGNTPEGQSCYDSNNPILPGSNGTMMSRCHLLAGNAINLASGFGSEPGSLLYNNFVNSTCNSGSLCTGIPPINDICATAIHLDVTNRCKNSTYDNNLVTSSGATPGFSCGSVGTTKDIWFSLTVPPSGDVNIRTTSVTGGLTDVVMQTYTGTCGNLTQLMCDDNSGAGNHAFLAITNQTPGATIFIRIVDSGSNNEGEFSICAFDQNQPCQIDIPALLAIYNSLGGASWSNNTGWIDGLGGTNCDICTWHGVVCDGEGRVIELNLPSNNLVGSLPAELEDLPKLEKINFYGNMISGTIPSFLINIIYLNNLDLGSNQMTGNIPVILSSSPNLNTLYLDNNTFNGPLPIGLELAPLTTVWLQNNNLDGCIPNNYSEFCLRGATLKLGNNPLLPFGGDYDKFCIDSLGADFDNDGFCGGPNDCLDTNPSVYINAPEICDGLDNDCNGMIDEGIPNVTNNWLGIDDNWDNLSNWSTGIVPKTCHDVVIDPGAVDSVILYALSDGFAASLFIGQNGILHIQNFTNLTIENSGAITNNGILSLYGDIICSYPSGILSSLENNGQVTIGSSGNLVLEGVVDQGILNNAMGIIDNTGIIQVDSTTTVNGSGFVNFGTLNNQGQITLESINGIEMRVHTGSSVTNEGTIDIK